MEEDTSEMLHRLVLEESPSAEKLTDCFRSLRDSCRLSPQTQSKLGQQQSVLSDANSAISLGLSASADEAEQWNLCLRVSAQFLGNLIVNNPQNQQTVLTRCSSQLKKMAQHGDPKLTNISLMVVYNIMLLNPNVVNDFVKDEEFVEIICESGAEGVEFSQYICERFLSQDVDWSRVYNRKLSVSGRLFLLDVVEQTVKKASTDAPLGLTRQLAAQFCQQSDCILRTVADQVDSLEPVEVATLLRILASLSPHPPHLQALQADTSFFINCAFLLKSIHMAGKEQNNCFSAVQKLSALEGGEELQSHPAFGFKASLIQVLGNLCYKYKPTQDLMKELDLIPLLLDCCNIDARNPFIIQWVVLAVRNLCEGNHGNQALIASLSRQGLVESRILTELGVTIHADQDNNCISIAPLSLNK